MRIRGRKRGGWRPGRLSRRKSFPLFSGAALADQGIRKFLHVSAESRRRKSLALRNSPLGDRLTKFSAGPPKGKEISLIKIKEGGSLRPRDEVAVSEQAGEFHFAKVQELWMNNSNRYESVPIVHAGDVCGDGTGGVRPGDGIGSECYHTEYETRPLLSARVLYDAAIPHRRVLECLQILEEEDPLLSVRWEEALSDAGARHGRHTVGCIAAGAVNRLGWRWILGTVRFSTWRPCRSR